MKLLFLEDDANFFIAIAISLVTGLISVHCIKYKMKSKGINTDKTYIMILIITACTPILLFPILFHPNIPNFKKILIVFLSCCGSTIQIFGINIGRKYIKDKFGKLDNVD